MKKPAVWVTANNQVKKSGATRASKSFKTQKSAFEFARKLAIKEKTELLMQGKNGQIRLRNSYGNDPQKIKG